MQRLVEITDLSGSQILGAFADLKKELVGLRADLKATIAQSQVDANLPENMTIKEVCAMLRINNVTCWKWTKSGKLTAYRIGSKKYYKRSEVQMVFNNSKAA